MNKEWLRQKQQGISLFPNITYSLKNVITYVEIL